MRLRIAVVQDIVEIEMFDIHESPNKPGSHGTMHLDKTNDDVGNVDADFFWIR